MNPTTSAQALGNVENFTKSMQSPDQIYGQESQSLGVPGAQQQVSGLRQAITNTTNLLNNVAPSVMGRTQNSLVTAAQAGRQIQNEQAPIQQKLAGLNTSESNAASDLSSLLSRASELSNLKVQGQNDKLTGLKNIYDALFGKEQAAASQKLEAQKLAEQAREFGITSNQEQQKINQAGSGGGLTANEMLQEMNKYQVAYKPNDAGYAFKGPNGSLSMYQYSSGINQGDVSGIFNTMKGLLSKSPDPYGKQAYKFMTALEAAKHSPTDILKRMASNYGLLF